MIVSIVFAAGCFWGVEKFYDHFDGVIKAESGYVGGNYPDPTYKKVLHYRHLKKDATLVNYAEGVKVTFDNEKVQAKTLIKAFWELHDPTQLNYQGNDVGNNYRSAIYYTNTRQEKAAFATKEEYQQLLSNKGYSNIVTQIQALKKFYPAEKYHQDYLEKNPYGYCPNHATGVKFSHKDVKIKYIMPLGAKEILVIKSKNYCPYCEKFEADVSSHYKGSIPLRTVVQEQLKGFSITSKMYATPTIIFINDAKEIISHVGYMNRETFYKTLGAFKLGKNSQAYNVAFHEGTDAPGCKAYKIFEDTPDGVFIDKLSGDILFDTRDRFHSGTGWLSFYTTVGKNVIEKVDNSYGMKRTEIVARKSGIHLGHVFPRADGRKRFCIDATVLEFVPRNKIKNFVK